MFHKVYDWMLRLAAHRHALRSLAVISFAESSFFPIPPDVMVIPMVLARRDQAWRIAAVAAGSSILGGCLGYAIGYFLWDSVGRPVADFYHITAAVEDYRQKFQGYAAPIILVQGMTPIPFKLVAIASGLAKVNFLVFIACATVTRSARFFVVATLIRRYGAPMQAFIEKRMALVGWAVLAILAAAALAIWLF
ncbi:MAG: DedA family protein [Sphingomonadaceae bacterium]|nr:DedA family protein [Sphingomonadaceae bacterium]